MQTTNHILVNIDKLLDDEIVLTNGMKLYKAAQFQYEWNVTVTGKVAATNPKFPVQEGDEVAFSFQVINDREWSRDGSTFQMSSDASSDGSYYEWVNGDGDHLRKLKDPFYRKWTAVWLDKGLNFKSMWQGSESDVDKWISQFSFSDSPGRNKNRYDIDDVGYWKVDPQYLIAKKVGEEIEMLSSRVMVKPIIEDITKKLEIRYGMVIPDCIEMVQVNKGEVVAGGEKLGLLKGQVIGFEEQYREKYTVWGGNYYLIKESRVLGVFS